MRKSEDRSHGFPMVEFELTEEQLLMQKTAHTFAEREMRPISLEYDKKGVIPWHVVQKAHDIALDTAFLPEAYGGGGVTSTLTHCVVNEELNWGCAGIATGLIGAGLAYLPIIHMGTEAQKDRFLRRVTGREAKLGALCLTEPDPRGQHARRGGPHRVLRGDEDPGVLEAARCGGGRRDRQGGVRVRAGLQSETAGVRRPDREEAGDRVHARGHEDADRGGAPADVAGRMDARCRHADEQGSVDREALRSGHGDGGHDGRRANPRRDGVHAGRARGKMDAGCEGGPDLGGGLTDPAPRDLP